MPSFICNAVFEECITANVGNARGQQECEDDRDAACDPDELLDAFAENTATTSEAPATTSSSATASSTSASDASQTSEEPEPSATGDNEDSLAASTAAPVVGAAALAAAVFAYLA